MTRMFLSFRVSTLAALLVLIGAAPGNAQDQIFVIESTAAPMKVGTAYAMSDRITIPAGATIRVVMPSGKTQTIKGPYSGLVADLARGEKANQDVVSWIKNLLLTGGSNERTPGATRGVRAADPPAGFSWTTIPTTADSTICVEKGARLQLRRASSARADRVTVVDLETSERGESAFSQDSETAPWPAEVKPRPDGAYVLLAPDNRPRRQLTLRVLDRLPKEEDILHVLAARGCKHQFDAWVKAKIAAARKPS